MNAEKYYEEVLEVHNLIVNKDYVSNDRIEKCLREIKDVDINDLNVLCAYELISLYTIINNSYFKVHTSRNFIAEKYGLKNRLNMEDK